MQLYELCKDDALAYVARDVVTVVTPQGREKWSRTLKIIACIVALFLTWSLSLHVYNMNFLSADALTENVTYIKTWLSF